MIPRHVLDWLEEARRRGVQVRTDGGTDLDLTRRDFECYALVEPDGAALLRTLEGGAWREAEERGLVAPYRSPQGARFRVPDWAALVVFLRACAGAVPLSAAEVQAGLRRGDRVVLGGGRMFEGMTFVVDRVFDGLRGVPWVDLVNPVRGGLPAKLCVPAVDVSKEVPRE